MKIRLPFALALLAVSVTLAAVNLLPFSPPDAGTRTAASEVATAPALLRPFLADGLYAPLTKPEKGDWIAQQKEKAQSVQDYRKSGANLPDQNRKVLYLLPLGDFPQNGRTPSLEVLREYLGLYFGMEARLAPAVKETATGAKRRINPSSKKPQLLTTDLLAWLPQHLPADAYSLLAVTMTDLYPEDSWNFVFGQATYKARVGVFSLARNDPAFWGDGDDGVPLPMIQALLLRRACTVLTHETGHMFGISHCRYYQCLMGGSNGLDESDRAPAGLCPVCLHKLYLAKAFDPIGRQKGLVKFYQDHGMERDRLQAVKVLGAP